MTWLSKRKPVAAVAATLILATTSVAFQKRQDPAPITDIATNRALAQQQLPLIDKALHLMHNLAQGSKMNMGDPEFSIWERRRLDALHAAGSTKPEIIAALEKDLKRIEQEEAISKSQFESARATQLGSLDAHFRGLQTQIWLNEEKAR